MLSFAIATRAAGRVDESMIRWRIVLRIVQLTESRKKSSVQVWGIFDDVLDLSIYLYSSIDVSFFYHLGGSLDLLFILRRKKKEEEISYLSIYRSTYISHQFERKTLLTFCSVMSTRTK